MFVRKNDIAWFDKRQVNLATDLHNERMFSKQLRAKTGDHIRTVEKPVAIELYTRFMGGVDRADQKLWTLLPCHRTNKWWVKVFFYLYELTMVNARIIYLALNDDAAVKRDITKFRLDMVGRLLEGNRL